MLARALGEHNYLVDVYVPKFSRRYFIKHGLPNREIDLGPNVKIHRLPSLPLPMWLFDTRLTLPTLAGYRQLKKNRPDLIHTQTIWGAGLEALWSSRKLKIPLVGTNHTIIGEFGTYFPFAKKTFVKLAIWYETWYYHHCAFVTAPSRIALEAMQKNNVGCQSRIISNIIDTENFKPLNNQADKEKLKAEFGLAGRPVISFAGRFAIEKRGEILFQAISLIRGRFPRVILALAGSGIQRDNWDKEIRQLDLQNNIKFVGVLDKPRLVKLFQASDAFAIASAIESQGMVALQAMACGLPVVGVNGRALPEYVNSQNGFIVPINDYQEMSKCLTKLLIDPVLARHLGQNGRQQVEKYSKQNIIKEWEEIYKKI